MTRSSTSERVKLALSEDSVAPGDPAPWIGPLVALGGMTLKYAEFLSGRQLIVAVSVPRRDFAAVLVGCGWVIATRPPQLDTPIQTLRQMDIGGSVRLVTGQEVIADRLEQLDERNEPVVRLTKSQWIVSKLRAAAKLPALESPMRSPRPRIGSLGHWAGLDPTWDLRLAKPPSDLAIVGTLSWITEDLGAYLGTDERSTGSDVTEPQVDNETIANLLLPKNEGSSTWFSQLYSASRLADQLPLPKELRAVILDGAGAIKYLGEVEAPVVICILDRSVADETAAEIVVQIRNTRGEPVSLRADLGWRPPLGVEAVAFTVAL